MDRTPAQSSNQDKLTQKLIAAIQKNNDAAVTKYLNKGANSNHIQSYSGEPMLHLACKKGNPLAVKLLLKHGALVNAVNKNGETALFKAVNVITFKTNAGDNFQEAESILNQNQYIQTKLLSLLIKHGIDVNKPNQKGDIALLHACLRTNLSSVRFLIENGAKADGSCIAHVKLSYSSSPNEREICDLCCDNLFPDVRRNLDRLSAIDGILICAFIDYGATNYINNLEHFLDISYLPGHLINIGLYAITFITGFFS